MSYVLHTYVVNCVKLTLFLILTLAPNLANILTALVSPFSDAMYSGVSPFCNSNVLAMLINTYVRTYVNNMYRLYIG